MLKQASIKFQNGLLEVSGELDFKTAANLWQESLPYIHQQYALRFDLSNVKSSNSAGLALILAWIRYAKQCKKAIHFNRIPTQLNSIIAVSGVGELLASFTE